MYVRPAFRQSRVSGPQLLRWAQREGSELAVLIDGVDRTRFTNRFESDILDVLNESPNTCTLMVRGFTPTVGLSVQIDYGSVVLFRGLITQVTNVQRRSGTRIRYRLSCIDWTFLLDRRLMNKGYASQTSGAIAADIIATYTSGFTSSNVQSGLSTISDFPNKMESVSQALTRLANLAGAFWYIDSAKDLHFRTSESQPQPTTLDASNNTFRNFQYRKDLLQVRTRVYVEGAGSVLSAPRVIGDTTIPVDDSTVFASSGGSVITNTQVLTYTGKNFSAGGETWTTRTGPAASWDAVAWSERLGLFASVSASTAVMTSPDGMTWTSRTGVSGVWLGVTWASGLALFVAVGTNVIETSPDGVTWTTRTSPQNNNWYGPAASLSLALLVSVADAGVNRVMTSPDGITWTLRTAASASTWKAVAWADELALFVAVGTGVVMTSPDGVTWTSRTAADGSTWRALAWAPQLRLFVAAGGGANFMTSPDGLTWTLRAATANKTWTAVVWTGDRFLAVSSDAGVGLINASIDGLTWTAHTAPGNGAWIGLAASHDIAVAVGTTAGVIQVMSASGTAQLVGVPATGVGSITAGINAGDDINLFVQCDDATAQTTLAALEGGDGIHEHYIQDRRLSIAGATARGTAELTLGKDADEVCTLVSEDPYMISGRTITISALSGISTSVLIQQVRIFWEAGRKAPQRDVTATNRFKDFYQYVRDLEDKARKAA